MTKRPIAVAIVAIFFGAQLAVAALDENASAEGEGDIASLLALETPSQPAPEQTANTEQAAAPEQDAAKEQVAAVEPAAPVEPAAAAEQPLPARPVIARSNAFPRSADEQYMLPTLAAYLEQREARLAASGQLIARGDVFPRSADDQYMLPTLVEYLAKREQRRASIQLAQSEVK
ncbi:MAG: hypothetical protein FJY54_04965 [Betaproteobacteria bacterium]|nr:hypothetical protein [Betaproteobacteria bacterium]